MYDKTLVIDILDQIIEAILIVDERWLIKLTYIII
jgi:hypothetical protein